MHSGNRLKIKEKEKELGKRRKERRRTGNSGEEKQGAIFQATHGGSKRPPFCVIFRGSALFNVEKLLIVLDFISNY